MAKRKRLMVKWIIILAAIAMIIWCGALAFRYFVTDRIMDKGGMENSYYVQQLDGLSYDMAEQTEDLCAPWSSDEGYAVSIDGETLTLSENGVELCAKEYCAISDGIYRIYAMDGGGFGEFDYFDYAPGVLTGCIGSNPDNPVYVEFSHR